jgi:hypothetical protein
MVSQFVHLNRRRLVKFCINLICLGTIPLGVGDLAQLKSLSLEFTNIDGSIPLSLCTVGQLQRVSLEGLHICYPGCLEESITSASNGVSRCQDDTDFILCGLAEQFSSQIEALDDFYSVTYQSTHPWDGPSTVVAISGADIVLPNNISNEKIHSFSISFNSWTDRVATSSSPVVICSANDCTSYADTLPGVLSVADYTTSYSNFNLTFVPSSCQDYLAFGGYCFGYAFTVKAYYSSGYGWSCTSPPLGAKVADEATLANMAGLQLNETYAVSRCSWSGISCTRGLVTEMNFANLGLTGTIPNQVFGLIDLKYVDVSFNHFTGTLPNSIGNALPSLSYLSMASNQFTGPLPVNLSHLNLLVLDLSYNSLDGSIPMEYIAFNRSLYTLNLANNMLSGTLTNALCPLASIDDLSLSGNNFACIQDCWVRENTSLALVDPESYECQPTLTTTDSPASTTFNVLYVIPIVIGSLIIFYLVNRFLCTSRSVKVFQENEKKRGEMLLSLPLHVAVMKKNQSIDEVIKLIESDPTRVHFVDFDNKTAWDWALGVNADPAIVLSMIRNSLPLTMDKQPVDPVKHRYCWARLVQIQMYADVVRAVLNEYGHAAKELAEATDDQGRTALSIASPGIAKLLRLRTFFYSRYEILTLGAPLYASKTCIVHRAIDHIARSDTDTSTSKVADDFETPRSTSRSLTDNSNVARYVPSNMVALKFFASRDSFLLEQSCRQQGRFSGEYVVGILDALDAETDDVFGSEVARYGLQAYPQCIVLSCGERNLTAIIRSELLLEDMQQVRLIVIQLLRAVQHLHCKGFIHGDLKPQNIVRFHQKLRILDLDSATQIGQEFHAAKFSTAYIPPEIVAGETIDTLKHVGSIYLKSPTSLHQIPRKAFTFNSMHVFTEVDNNADDAEEEFSVSKEKTLHAMAAIGAVDMNSPSKPLLRQVSSHPSFDIWSLGVVVYELCAGITLFWQDNNDNIDHENLMELVSFDLETKMRKLSKIQDPIARNFVHQMLTADPARRPRIDQLLCHSFLTGQTPARLVGNAAEYDVFISYRVRSDAQHAGMIYELLTSGGLRVWWDQRCLQPGLSWEDGFCDGLAKSRIFLPILSRGAINHPTDARQNFSMLTEQSPCDNVLLEYHLALELRAHGLIERIFPVMIGDMPEPVGVDKTADLSYSDYFASGCHPAVADDLFVSSVLHNVAYHLNRQCLGSPLIEVPSVSNILGEVMKSQGLTVRGPVHSAFEKLLGLVKQMLGSDGSFSSRKSVKTIAVAKLEG